LDKEEKTLVIFGLVLTVILAVIFGVPSWLQLYSIPPPNFMPLLTLIGYILIIALPVIVIFFVSRRYYPSLSKSMNEHYSKRIYDEVYQQIKDELILNNIIFPKEIFEEFLTAFTNRVVVDIMHDKMFDECYSVRLFEPPNNWKIDGVVLPTTQESAENIAEKMWTLYKDKKFKKRIYRYRSLFM
jgi:hypothetical protein